MPNMVEEARDAVLVWADQCECGSGDDRDLWEQALERFEQCVRGEASDRLAALLAEEYYHRTMAEQRVKELERQVEELKAHNECLKQKEAAE